jgi:hypothetical protein
MFDMEHSLDQIGRSFDSEKLANNSNQENY